MTDLTALSQNKQIAALKRRHVSARELTLAYLARIEEVDPSLGAYLTVTAERALLAADQSDQRRAAGADRGDLDGIPFAVKDNLSTDGIRTTCGSRFLENYTPPFDATAVRRLTDAGAILLGKLNMDEFGMGSSTEFSAYHPTRNPHDLTRVSGGSSGGSAAAVSARLASFCLGSDTGGSIRQPAAFCGVVGLKPTYGTVSRYGLVAFASSLDQIGPLTRRVEDSARVLRIIAGHDPMDATTASHPVPDYSALLGSSPKGLRVGICPSLLESGVSPAVQLAIRRAAGTLESMGAVLIEEELPSPTLALSAYYVLSAAEASSNLARYDGVRYGTRANAYGNVEELFVRSRTEGFGSEVKRRILLGTFALSEGYSEQYYEKARQARGQLSAAYARLFERCDLLLIPSTPSVAFPLGAFDSDPAGRYAQDLYTVPASLAGLPALSLPYGCDGDGLPIGIQLIAPPFAEARLLGAAAALEERGGDDE